MSLMLAAGSIQAAAAADLYVDGVNGSDSNSGTQAAPYRNVWRAWYAARPGDTVHLLPTTTYGPIWLGGKSGYAGKPITLRGAGSGSNMTKVSGFGSKGGIMLEKGRSHIVIRNLNVTAPGHGKYAGHSGIHLLGNTHVSILNNYVHDSGCSGIQTTHSDYLTISGNRIARNGKDTHNNIFCSGISTHENLDSDSNTGTKIRITNNSIDGNTNTLSANCKYPCTNSDGSGIIIDDTRRTQTDYRAYKGHTLIENNVIVNSGGRGIHIFYSDNVSIFGNTLWHNNQDSNAGSWRPGEISIIQSGGVNVYNNILHSQGGWVNKHSGDRVSISVQDCTKGGAINIHDNLLYNSLGMTNLKSYTRNNNVPVNIGTSNRFGNPHFNNPSKDLNSADFRVKSSSAAIDFASPSWTVPSIDFLHRVRTMPVTAGAYEFGL